MEETDMVIRMRIYQTGGPDPAADDVFYRLVKPVHERHGANFLGRYVDRKGRHVVIWSYPDLEVMEAIQERVANDEETIRNKSVRLHSGLHGIPFEEYIMESTDPKA
jgi:hypothetical protein